MKSIRQKAAVWTLTAAVCFIAIPASGQPAQDTVKIFGRVTDFKNQPIEGASIELKDAHFETVAQAASGKDGAYVLTAKKGSYMALLAVKDYQIRFLEYWAWSVPAFGDLEINPRFDKLEIYGINAWRPHGGYPSYMIYFRPMSLTRIIKKITEAGGMKNFQKLPHLDMAPELSANDLVVTIDGQAVNILKVNKILEAAGPGQDMTGYIIQTNLPAKKTNGEYSLITITVNDPVTGDAGEGAVFFRQAPN